MKPITPPQNTMQNALQESARIAVLNLNCKAGFAISCPPRQIWFQSNNFSLVLPTLYIIPTKSQETLNLAKNMGLIRTFAEYAIRMAYCCLPDTLQIFLPLPDIRCRAEMSDIGCRAYSKRGELPRRNFRTSPPPKIRASAIRF